jgi:hypothetical protein
VEVRVNKLGDLAALGGLFLLAMYVPAVMSDATVLADLEGADLALILGLAVAVGALVTMFAYLYSYTASYFLGSRALSENAPEVEADVRALLGDKDNNGYVRWLTATHVLLTGDEATRSWVTNMLTTAEGAFNAATAIVLGVIASVFVFGPPDSAGWVGVALLLVLAVVCLLSMVGDVMLGRRVIVLSLIDRRRRERVGRPEPQAIEET